MSTTTNFDSQHMLHIATLIASHGHAVIPIGYGGCSVPGCCGPALKHPWTYTVGLVEQGHPEIVLLGLDPHSAQHGINWVAAEAKQGRPVPLDRPKTVDGVGIKLIEVPGRWLATDLNRMAMWFNHYRPGHASVRHPDVCQLLWADAQGRFPDDPLCDPKIVAMQPVLASDPLRFPKPKEYPRRASSSRHRAKRRR
jgi:hypothetical protein